MQSSRELKSVRVGRFHFSPGRLLAPEDFKTVNAAKKHSRRLGGAGFVRKAASAEEARHIFRDVQS